MACQLELSKAQEKVGNVDGAPWIRNEIEFHGLVDALGLDFYHLRDNLQKSRRIVFGEESAQENCKVRGLARFSAQGGPIRWEPLAENAGLSPSASTLQFSCTFAQDTCPWFVSADILDPTVEKESGPRWPNSSSAH
jgi:hypothetical protein